MDFKLFDRVRIKDKDVTGTIVDIYSGENKQPVYVVQSSLPGNGEHRDAYPGEYPLFDCTEDQLVKI